MEGLRRDVPLAPLTTLGLGGPAEWLLEAREEAQVVEALRWARARALPVSLLGGGSNLLVPDEGVRGLVLRLATRGVRSLDPGRRRVAAGEDWDRLVARCVAERLAGVECLAGIPGRVGAAPIQNIGAYGQEVAETIAEVGVLDLATLQRHRLGPEQCGFGYRDSAFKRDPSRYLVLDVTFALRPRGRPSVRYRELQQHVTEAASLAEVRQTVLSLRRRKSMVLRADDPNRRSAGSFFVNPVVSPEHADALVARAVREGIVSSGAKVPRWIVPGGVKLAAGWLIERAGFPKGTRRGNVGLSSAHALALVHHGGGTTAELLAFAEAIRRAVHARFGVTLEREPRILTPVLTPDGGSSPPRPHAERHSPSQQRSSSTDP